MDLTNVTVWQQAAGDNDRNYAELCIRWDVILNGPGHFGQWPECEPLLLEKGITAKKVTDLRRFCDEMADGDIVVLRVGTAMVIAVGQAIGKYEWHDGYGDVDGWNLQHVRRVRWLWSNLDSPKVFDTYALKLGDTTQRLNDGAVTQWLSSLVIPDEAFNRPLALLPNSPQQDDITVPEISEFLFGHGVASASITNLVNEIGELIRIAKWYQRTIMPSEHETVAYLIVPLLRALGWTPQRMAVEWNYVDLALFASLPRSEESLQVVVEAKRMDNSCLTAKSQAMSYASGKDSCHRLIVTDGLRYGVFVRNQQESFRLHAYMNLTRLKREYHVYECKGAEEALLAMSPEWRLT